MWTKTFRAASATRWAALVVTAALACSVLTIQSQAAQASPGNPLIAVFITQNHVVGFHWPVGTVLTLTIDDPATLDSIDYQDIEIVEADPDPFVPGSTAARFWLGEAFTIQPGHIVTLSGGGETRTHSD